MMYRPDTSPSYYAQHDYIPVTSQEREELLEEIQGVAVPIPYDIDTYSQVAEQLQLTASEKEVALIGTVRRIQHDRDLAVARSDEANQRAEDAEAMIVPVRQDNMKKAEEIDRLREASRYDSLTGALTEEAFKADIELELLKDPNGHHGLIFVDLGNFKKANAFGHDVGDRVLSLTANLFRRGGDMVARSSKAGDEFMLFVDLQNRQDANRSTDVVLNQGIDRLDSLRDEIITEYPELDEGKVRFFIGTGGVVYDETKSYDENRRLADVAMEELKTRGYETYGKYRVED